MNSQMETAGGHISSAAAVLMLFLLSGCGAQPEQPLNVLFIAVDDLRPQAGSYGETYMHTPNLDRLAETGVSFMNHFVQAPTCGASRYSMLTGQRPRPARPASYGNGAFELLPQTEPDRAVSLPHQFRRNGYRTVSIGKISHSPDGRQHEKTTDEGATDDPQAAPEMPFAWDDVYGPRGQWDTAWRAFFAYAGEKSRVRGLTPAVEAADVDDRGYPDGLIADAAQEELRDLQERGKPFFMAVGFYKPHLPFTAPQQYWDHYDADELSKAPFPSYPEGVNPSVSLHGNGELYGGYGGVVQDDSITKSEARTLRHAYFAAVSYVDAQVGKVLDELERLGLDDNTVVVLWGDHGWHLQDHGIWGKHTLYEYALRSPLIIRAPDTGQPGHRTEHVVESLDIYPTLVDLCRLPMPEGLDGRSVVDILEEPAGDAGGEAFGYWRRGDQWGKTVRTPRYRLTRWAKTPGGEPVQIELYDHQADPHETKNIAKDYPKQVQTLMQRLEADDERIRSSAPQRVFTAP